MNKQKNVDILGYIVIAGLVLMCLFLRYIYMKRGNLVGTGGSTCIFLAGLLIISLVRVFIYHKIPYDERRKYDIWIFGFDMLAAPYSQATILIFILFAFIFVIRF